MKELIQELLEEKQAQDIVVLDVTKKNFVSNYMIIASGTSARHLDTLSEYVYSELKKQKKTPIIEGKGTHWVLIDVDDVMVHLFKPDVRAFYALESFWTHEAV